MPNLVEKAKDKIGALVNGARKLIDPGNVDSQIQHGDLAEPDSKPAIGDAKKLVELGDNRYEEARLGRWRHNADILTGLAFFNGNHRHYWNESSGCMQPITQGSPDFSERFIDKTENVIRVMVERAVARVTASYPDAWGAPETDSDKDKQAAQVHRAVNAHCSRTTRRKKLLEEAALAMMVTTSCFIEVGWNAKAMADVGIPQADGSVQYHRAPIGDVHNCLMLGIDAYPDPNAQLSGQGIHGGAYFIKRCIRSLTYIQEKWGKTVSATCPSNTYGSLEQRIEWIAGDQSRQASKIKNATEITEVWEKPSEQFKAGRFWVYSGDGTMLHAGEWPYKNADGSPYADRYPFVEVYFQKNFGSVWGLNLVKDLIPDQMSLNRLATYLAGRVEWDKPVLLVPDTADVAPDDLISPHYGQVIGYKAQNMGGGVPQWFYPPSPGDFYFKEEQRLLASMERIAGVHDFNADTAAPPSSGYEFELRMQEDKSRLGPVIRRMCDVVVELYEWDAALYRQYGASFPRLLGLDDKAIPAKDLQSGSAATTALMDIQALRDGATRVVLQPGSGEAKLPAAQQEALMDMAKLLMAPGMTPPLAEFILNQSLDIRSDANVDRFLDAYKVYAAQQQQQKLAEIAAQGQNAQSLQQQKLQAQQQSDALDIQAEEEKAAIGVHAASLEQTWRMQTDMATESQRHDNAMEELQAKQSMPTISVSVPIKPGANTTRSIEEQAGWEPDDPAEIKAMNAPPVPKMAAPAKPKGASNGKS